MIVASTAATRAGTAARDHPAGGVVVGGLGQSNGTFRALNDVTFTAAAGTVVGLVGPNGSGKRTTLRLVCDLTDIREGEVAVAGEPAGTTGARRRLAFVPDTPTGFDELTVGEFCALNQRMFRPGPGYPHKTELMLGAFGLLDRRHTRLGALSTGM